MPIHWRPEIEIAEDNKLGRSNDGPQPPADDSSYQTPARLQRPADELLIRLRKALDPDREDDLQHDATMERDGPGQ